jgi:pimeloyl-ACP methyl ester carboxylesterase
MSRETVQPAGTEVCAAVIVAHGGRSVSTEPVTPLQLAVLRMIPLAHAVRRALRGSGAAVYRPRYQLRGWNGELASPVRDLEAVLDQLAGVPVVLIGHSMGARAAFRVAGHPAVSAVAGLAPWLPPGEPVDQLAGRPILLAHGSDDHTTDPGETWAYAERARSVTTVEAIEIRGGDHAMLRRAPLWHHIAADFSRRSLGLPTAAGPAPDPFQQL